jgi:hypothetical protein
MLDEAMVCRFDFLRIDHAIRHRLFVIMMRALYAEQQTSARVHMAAYARQSLMIVFFLRQMTDEKGFLVAIDNEVPDAANKEKARS